MATGSKAVPRPAVSAEPTTAASFSLVDLCPALIPELITLSKLHASRAKREQKWRDAEQETGTVYGSEALARLRSTADEEMKLLLSLKKKVTTFIASPEFRKLPGQRGGTRRRRGLAAEVDASGGGTALQYQYPDEVVSSRIPSGTRVAAQIGDDWLLCSVVRFKPERGCYFVEDLDVVSDKTDPPPERRAVNRYDAPPKGVVRLPVYHGKEPPLLPFTPKASVYCRYDDFTAFYPAKVVSYRPGAATIELAIENDDKASSREVSVTDVFAAPAGD